MFIDFRKMTPEVAAHLKKNSIEVFDYKDVGAFLKQYQEARKTNNGGEYSGHKVSQRILINCLMNFRFGFPNRQIMNLAH